MAKSERILSVALLCVQNARPLMSNVVKMLQGDKENTPPPSSPRQSLTQQNETDERTSEHPYQGTFHGLNEIELATAKYDSKFQVFVLVFDILMAQVSFSTGC
ncbi:hypothetical protein ACFX13_025810 [Malus domestica]